MAKRLTDRAFVLELIDKHIQDVDRPSATSIAEWVVRELHDLDALGDYRARRALHELPVPAVVQMAGSRLRENGEVGVGWNGSHVSLPARLAIDVRDSSGVPTGEKQYPLWVYESWEEIESLRDRLAAQRDGVAADVKAIEQVLRLRDQYPEAGSPFEACEMAGIDPEEIRVA